MITGGRLPDACVCGLRLQRSLRLCEDKASGEMIHCLDTKCETLRSLNDGHGGGGAGEVRKRAF
jgi:hypothetical protein